MPLVVMMHKWSPCKCLTSAAFKHHADPLHHANPLGLRHSWRVGMMQQSSTGKLLAGAALVHQSDQGQLLPTFVLKELKTTMNNSLKYLLNDIPVRLYT